MGSALHRSPEGGIGWDDRRRRAVLLGSGPRSPGCAEGTGGTGGHTRLLPTSNGWAAIASPARRSGLYGALISGDIDVDDPWPPIKKLGYGAHRCRTGRASRTPGSGRALPVRPRLTRFRGSSLALPSHVNRRRGTVGEGLHQPVEVRACEPKPLEPTVSDHHGVHCGRRRGGWSISSALWAGPLCAHLLGLGVRRSSRWGRTRPDGARRGNADFYNLLHGGHRSRVRPCRRFDRRSLAELVASADIVIEASRPRALRGFGIDAEKVAATRCRGCRSPRSATFQPDRVRRRRRRRGQFGSPRRRR